MNNWKLIMPLATLALILFLGACQQSSAGAQAGKDNLEASTDTQLTAALERAPQSEATDSIARDPNLINLKWSDLRDVKFEEKYYKDIDQWLLYPSFGESVKALEGKEVYISGYIIPVEPERYVLSANPFSSCFFCGNAGPESVMELELTSYDQVYYTDEWRTFKGTFKLNATDIDKLNYILVEAEPY